MTCRPPYCTSLRAYGLGLTCDGAGDESRTRDLNLGKVALYQLSYSRTESLRVFDSHPSFLTPPGSGKRFGSGHAKRVYLSAECRPGQTHRKARPNRFARKRCHPRLGWAPVARHCNWGWAPRP
jgi:hypothetical protein